MKLKVRVVESVLRYVAKVGQVEDWKVVKRENIVGLENEKMAMRLRERLNDQEKIGESWDVEV
jgi:hypothetical protein